ncbi:MAG: hypothetical protein P4L84_30625, partial [Isosphaeraceae bacterium]|nr:hypothetical protein [Isosphaeraceae bacterium]
PLPALLEIEKWIVPSRRARTPGQQAPSKVYDEAGLAPLDEPEAHRTRAEPLVSRLSALGEDRWACIKALSEFDCKGIEALGRWGRLLQPKLAERIARLQVRDRYRFLGWLVHLSDEFDEVPIPRLAAWLHRAGVVDADRFDRWPEEVAELVDVSGESRLRRAHLVAELRDELKRVLTDDRERRRIARVADSP